MIKSFFDNWEELFIGATLQFLLIFIVGWWVLPIMAVCAVLWRLGGWEHGNKLFRRIGVPLVVCGATFLTLHQWQIFLAGPFMVWLCPASYGKKSWLYKWLLDVTKNEKKANLLTRGVLYAWYWTFFSIALLMR